MAQQPYAIARRSVTPSDERPEYNWGTSWATVDHSASRKLRVLHRLAVQVGSVTYDKAISQQLTSERLTIATVESIFNAVSVALLAAAVMTMFGIVHDVFPYLSEEDRTRFPTWNRRLRIIDRTLRRAWNQHIRLFPESRKRTLFAALLVAASLSVMGYPLWVALASR